MRPQAWRLVELRRQLHMRWFCLVTAMCLSGGGDWQVVILGSTPGRWRRRWYLHWYWYRQISRKGNQAANRRRERKSGMRRAWLSYGAPCHMVLLVIWCCLSYGAVCHMVLFVIWCCLLYGAVCHMVLFVIVLGVIVLVVIVLVVRYW